MAKVPNDFHFVFGLRPQTEPFHLMYYLCLASCIGVNKPENVFFYYHYEPYGEYWDRIKPSLTLERVELNAFISNFHYEGNCETKHNYAHHADFIRLEKLIERGGIYADLDTIFVNKLPEHLFDEQFVMGKELGQFVDGKYRGSLCNAWIMSAKGAEFGKKWLAEMQTSFDGTWSAHSTLLPFKLSERYPELIHIEPERSFFKHPWTKGGIQNLFMRGDNDLADVYSFHLWSHLWWEKDRVDFSFFNKDLLTEEYVQFARSTYASIARKYLPKAENVTRQDYIKQILRSRVENVFLFSRDAYKKVGAKLKPQIPSE